MKKSEMQTGEGKTLGFTCLFECSSGKGVHLVTVNDYLAKETVHGWHLFLSFMD